MCLNGTPGQIGCQRDKNDDLNTREKNCNEQYCRKFNFAENNYVHIRVSWVDKLQVIFQGFSRGGLDF